MDAIAQLIELCARYGGPDYVLGGGGNASVKDGERLWIKPSGIPLSAVNRDTLASIDRPKVRAIFSTPVPTEPDKREQKAKELLLSAVTPGYEKFRPSVETPLHEAFAAKFVVHTHPALVNGLTCSVCGPEECRKMFPDALWMPYVDPGYTLSMEVHRAINDHQRRLGKQPEIIIKQNHGIFIAAETADRIIELYDSIMERLRDLYRSSGISLEPATGEPPSEQDRARVLESLSGVMGGAPAFVAASGWTAPARGSLTPDHIVYTKRHYLHSAIDPRQVVAFVNIYGHAPRVWVTDKGIFGIGTSESAARNALDFALDGALVSRLATCFGGPHYMSDEQSLFVDTWEVENYRRTVAESLQKKAPITVLSIPKPAGASKRIEQAYRIASEQFAEIGVDCEQALQALRRISLSVNCWQGDDVRGFENVSGGTAGICATGSAPGAARSPEELRSDIACALRLIPGTHRVNLHAIYADTGGMHVERNTLAPEHFASWVSWAKERGIGLDFNPTFFNHPRAAAGTLTNADPGVRRFWVEHAIASRRIGEYFGKALGTPAVVNIWIPDGTKDTPADRLGPRKRLAQSLDEIFAVKLDSSDLIDSVESKLFGIGVESYTAGSHEFYLSYALRHHLALCLDMGHFHPTESIADKLSALLLFLDRLLIHVSRPMRWDSDHVVTLTDELREAMREVIWNDWLDRVLLALDYFDASINRVAAWVIGARATLRALLIALLEPRTAMQKAENSGDFTSRLALMDESRMLPFGAVWDYFCHREGVPAGNTWLADIKSHEETVSSLRR
jgi:L-rhamnose isomerase